MVAKIGNEKQWIQEKSIILLLKVIFIYNSKYFIRRVHKIKLGLNSVLSLAITFRKNLIIY